MCFKQKDEFQDFILQNKLFTSGLFFKFLDNRMNNRVLYLVYKKIPGKNTIFIFV